MIIYEQPIYVAVTRSSACFLQCTKYDLSPMAKIEIIDPLLHVLLVSYRRLYHTDFVQHKLVGGAARCALLCFLKHVIAGLFFSVITSLRQQEILRVDCSIIEGTNISQILPYTTFRKNVS